MSYCRFGWDDSSVYIIESGGSLECCGCSLSQNHWNYKDVAAFLAHLDEHEARGDVVPPTVRTDIIEDWKDGRFKDWDETDPEAMRPYFSLPTVRDPRDYLQFLEENRHMLGWDEEKFNEFKQIWEEKQNEARREAADRPAEERGPGN